MARKSGKQSFNNLNHEIASEIGVNLKQGYAGDRSSGGHGSVDGNIVKRVFRQNGDTNAGIDDRTSRN